jgi:hypothetical protein
MKGFKEYYDSLDEQILTITGQPNMDKWLDMALKKPLYKKAVSFYLELRQKDNDTSETTAHKAILRTEKITGLDYRQIKSLLDQMVAKGKIPAHMTFDTTPTKSTKSGPGYAY